MARLVEAGCEVRYVAFSIATRSLPPGFPPDTLAREVREATAELGIPESHLTVHDLDVRTFPERRQDILELLVALWEEWRPDVVFQPSHHDVHQDHQTIAQEGLRAFKRTTILGYEIPVEQLRLLLRRVPRPRAPARRAQGRRRRSVRLAAAPPLCRRGLHLEPRSRPRHEREPGVRRGVRGVPPRGVGEGGLGGTDAVSPGERRIAVTLRPRSCPYLRIGALPASLPHDDRRHAGDEARSAKSSSSLT